MNSESVESMNQSLGVRSKNDLENIQEISDYISQRFLLHSIVWNEVAMTILKDDNHINVLKLNQIKIKIVIKIIRNILLYIDQNTQM